MKNKPEDHQPRVVLMIALASVVLVLFLLRLVYLQVIEGNHYLEQADNTTSYRFNITAARGEIVDCYGRSLATNTTGYNLVMNNLMLGDNDLNDTLKTLVEILQTSGDSWNDATPISSPDADGHYSFTDGDNTSDQNRLAAIKTALGLLRGRGRPFVGLHLRPGGGPSGPEPAGAVLRLGGAHPAVSAHQPPELCPGGQPVRRAGAQRRFSVL